MKINRLIQKYYLKFILNEKGNTAFEYILMLSIVVIFAFHLFENLETYILGQNGLKDLMFGKISELFGEDAGQNRFKTFPILR